MNWIKNMKKMNELSQFMQHISRGIKAAPKTLSKWLEVFSVNTL